MGKSLVDMRFVDKILYECTDCWGNYTIEYVDIDGSVIEEVCYADGGYSYRCLGEA